MHLAGDERYHKCHGNIHSLNVKKRSSHNHPACKWCGDSVFQGNKKKSLPLAHNYSAYLTVSVHSSDGEAFVLGLVWCPMGEIWFDLDMQYQVTDVLDLTFQNSRCPHFSPHPVLCTHIHLPDPAGPRTVYGKNLHCLVPWISTSTNCLVDCDVSGVSVCWCNLHGLCWYKRH